MLDKILLILKRVERDKDYWNYCYGKQLIVLTEVTDNQSEA